MKKAHLAHETRSEHKRSKKTADSKAKALALESADAVDRKRSRFMILVLRELRKQKRISAAESRRKNKG